MLFGLSIAFIPFFLGYFCRTNQKWLERSYVITTISLYLILITIGIAIGQLDNLATKLPQIGFATLVLTSCVHLMNILCLILFDKTAPLRLKEKNETLASRRAQLFESLKLCFAVIFGVSIGYFSKTWVQLPLHLSTYVLVVMLFFVGLQLRHSGIPLREVFLNRRGIQTAVVFMVSCLIGGVLAAICLNYPLSKGLAFASGFGWYSLSSVLISDAWGAIDGGIAFFNDLLREIFCLFAIPFFMRRFPSTAVGLGGATAMDCTLPIIQKSGGIQIVPVAISFGVITNLAAPILMAFFIGIG